jgi:type II secretory pathway pseudopilin PulG
MVRRRDAGTTLLILMILISFMTVGLLVALPVWHTQVRRELEEELIFRGRQYVEAIRIYQTKNPGAFPKDLDELVEERCLRKIFRDPMTKDGRWVLILQQGAEAVGRTRNPGIRPNPQAGGSTAQGQTLLLVPEASLSSISNPRIIGVASASTRTGFRLYEENETYDTWLFYYGSSPTVKPEIIRFGEPTKRP